MDKRRSLDGVIQEQPLPIPVQMFLWRHIRPFIRAKLGKLHEASCTFCQHAPGHHEMKEACTCLERVLVQNLHNDLTPSLSPLPYVLHATASLLHNRKDFQSLGTMETTLLYILHWILLDSAEECSENEVDPSNPFFYLFPIPTMTLFVYLFAPLFNHLKDIDFKTNLRLENGLKIWSAMYECRHPEASCFTAHCRAKPRIYWNRTFKSAKHHILSDDVFVGGNIESPLNQSFSDQSAPPSSKAIDDDQQSTWLLSPKDTVFPETIPEESSGAEDEHVVIFRLPSLSESERMLDGVKEVSTIFAGEASIFHVAMGRTTSSSKSTLTIEQVTAISGLDTCKQYHGKTAKTGEAEKEKEEKICKAEKEPQEISKTHESVSVQRQLDDATTEQAAGSAAVDLDVRAATFLDVATLRCLFVTQWQEEGIFWALQFLYYRLRRINEEISVQQMPRRRSNSLPIPKIEVSIYQSPESKKKDVLKDFIEVPDTRDTSLLTGPESESSHTRRASEKTKKRMKMADLKAFVETKLLSKSDKALEKIGQDEPKMLFEQECHRSLDTGDDHLTRRTSTSSKIFEAKDVDYMKHPTNLIKGKSMPSLSCLINELTAGGYVGDTRIERKQSRFYSQSYTAPNPIITVTEHTPTPSPDYMKRQGSIDSQLDLISVQGGRLCSERKPSLTRSQTDSNITYMSDEMPEAPGSACYITKEGDIDFQVVLKAIHSVALRDNVSCTLRVCEIMLNLIELLMDMGVMKHCLREEATGSNAGSGTGIDNKSETGKKQDSPMGLNQQECKHDEKGKPTAHNLLMNCVIRVLKHLGCPHGCLDGVRGPQADICRSQGQTILTKLHRASSRQFSRFLRTMIREQPLTEIMDFFHAYVGYCVDPSSLLSPLNQKRISSKSPDATCQSGYATNFGAGMIGSSASGTGVGTSGISGGNVVAMAGGVATSYNVGGYGARGIEGQIIAYVFKVLVTRLVDSAKQMKAQENISLYCDVRQLMTYVKEAHGSVFRRVALSGILDSADRPNKRCNSNVQTTRVIRHIHQSDLEEHADIGGDTCYTVDDRGTRKFLFKKRSTSSTCAAGSNLQSLLETELSEESVKVSQSPLGNLRKKHHVLTPRQSERNLGIGEPYLGPGKMRKSTRFQIGGIVNWFRKEYSRTDSTDSHESSESPTDGSFVRQPSFHYGPYRSASRTGRGVSLTFLKAKRRMEDQLNKIGFGKSKKKESMEETPGSYFSRRNSMELGEACRESEFVVLKERRLVPRAAVFNGMLRFSFLLETCQPGSVPDPHLMASLLDLPYAPVVSRACLILECAHLVHQCNKGHWPAWMKHNFPMFRPSVPINNRNASTALRRVHILQRTAGKLFYQWAEAIGARLEEFLAEDKHNMEQVTNIVSDESKQRDLILEDEEEDFLDEASINSYGSQCPFALRHVACILLLEVTAFLRETYQILPKSSKLLTKERHPPWERMYSREANRRWSVALSSMGHSQASAQSLQSIAGEVINREGIAERKISFVLYEPDNESEGSSKSTVTIQGEEAQNIEKEKAKRMPAPPSRPFLLRRSPAGTGSFKKRSLKLRRNTKEGKDTECEAYTVKRTDSIQSKRKVSSLSDRSDTSEPGAAGEVSGEESPGILSDDQPPESPSDSNETDETNKNFPWMKVLVQLANSFNFYCSHQNFCHPFCHRRQMRASSRLVKSVRKIYGEKFGILNGTGLLDVDTDKKEDSKKDKRSRKVSDQTSTQVSPVRRKDSVGRKYKIEKNLDGSQSGRSTQRDSSKDLAEQDSEKGKESSKKIIADDDVEEDKELPPILKYVKTQVKDAFHAPLATLIKGAVVITEDLFVEVLPVAWELLLESNQEVAASAAALFIISAVRAPNQASELMHKGLQHSSSSVRINAILRFQVLWKLRYQVWPRMEEAAHLTFKVPPPGIEFTLPSPKIGIESLPVVDPPWMPQVKTKVEEVTINQERHRSLVTATKTRKKQQTELIKKALQAQDDKKREERENFLITTIPITVQAAYEPSPVGDDHDEGNVGDEDAGETVPRNTSHHSQSALSLFPSSLCSAIVQIINLLDDPAVSDDGNAVYEVAYQVIWSCLVEDSALFLRYVLERLTREKQELMFKILRHLIRFVPKLPQQAAFALYNYIIGYVMFYVRSPHEEGQKLIGTALSILWMVVHSVHGIMFKDLKQILRKEQCDASILLTANVPSAKKIIVHGPQDPDAGEIPSQFPVQEDTQFCQILRESLDFFGVEESKQHEYFLVDYKTHQIHNPSSYVRDYYFFKRSQFPQIELVHMKPEDAFNALQRQELMHKFVEIGKVLLTWAILKNVDMVVQRVVFLHEELMKLPSFPRKALEADLDLYKGGEIGRVKTLVNNSEALTKYYNGPQKSSPEHKGSSQKNYGKGPYSPGFDFEDDTHTTKYIEHSKVRRFYDRDNEDAENFHKNEFRRPRNTLLNMVGDFVARCSTRLIELNKKSQDGKNIELLDSKCHVRLADIAHSLLKISPYDPTTMACRGLRRYMNDILPSTEWAADDMRPALTLILRRLDKIFSKIHKKASVRRNTNWVAASNLLKGVYETLSKSPYIAHFQYLKTLLNTCQALIVGDTPPEDITSASAAAVMSKIPPPHFCSTVLRLIALHVISFGEGYSLENVLGGQSVFANQTRTENALLNLLIPLFLRIGTGRKDVPKLKQSDISFALTAVLNTLWPPSMKAPLTVQKPSTDIRTGSLTFAARDPKTLTKTSLTLYQVAFLALKIMTICFETELRTEWPKVLRTMRLLNKRNEASIYLWSFIEFVVTHRTALYIQMLPFIVYKIGQAPISEHERNMHSIIREKINGSIKVPKSRGALLMDLIHELKNLKEEIEDRRFDEMQPEPKRSVADMHPIAEGQPRTQRPSLLMDLLTGDLGSRAHINRTPSETLVSHSTTAQLQPHSAQSNFGSTVKTMQSSQVTAVPSGTRIGGSISSAGSSTLREASDTINGETCVEQQTPSTTDRFQPSSTSDERNHVKLHPILPHQKAPKLRFVSSVEFRNSSGETVTSQLSPSSLIEDGSGEFHTDRPRLQRSMGQSKKTFRLRKSRKSHIEMTQTKSEQQDATLIEETASQTKSFVQASSASAVDPPLSNIPSDSSSIRSRRSLSVRKSDGDKSTSVPTDQQQFHVATHQHHHCHYYHHHLHPQVSDVSWDEDTSSTSGYRESYSLQLMSLDGTNRSAQAPPLASPDLNDMPSTSSTTTNYIAFDGSSPDCSINGSGGEKTALLTSSQRTTSQHSLLMVFPNQDEDTLI
ncbi:protein unc-80 homolog [Formica exsecta]|uniref:protein unc-80 homolog n=1 Tax=Formica exsecta TaxID=72781 RepID=UPI0011422DF4|nr:protein unc-80 homolog [Formica exsecta]